jgi:glycosyltransferase involved in cell wall biosynthesis
MKLLQLCHKPVFTPFDGGKIAMNSMAKGLLSQGVEIQQLMIETPNHKINHDFVANHAFDWKSSFIDTKISFVSAFLNLFSPTSYNLSRFNSTAYNNQIIKEVKTNQIDVVLAEGIYTLAGIDKLKNAGLKNIILRAHNVEHLIWKRTANQQKNPFKRYYLTLMANRLQRDELRICNKVAGIIAISEVDADVFRSMGVKVPITVVGIGVEFPKSNAKTLLKRQLFHLGSMDWMPNKEGIDWFIANVWPNIRLAMPDLKFVLAGYNMPERFKLLEDNGIEVKEATNSAEFFQSEGVMIVPLQSGSGIRVKILEGLSLGIPVISTKVGVEGIPVTDKKHLFIADTPEAFVLTISELFSDPALQAMISENAITFANENYRIERLGEKSCQFIRDSLDFEDTTGTFTISMAHRQR